MTRRCASSEAQRQPLEKTSPTRGPTSPLLLSAPPLLPGRPLLCLEELPHLRHQQPGGKRRLRPTLTWRTSGQSSLPPWSTCQEAGAACAHLWARRVSPLRPNQKMREKRRKGTRAIDVRLCRPCPLEPSVWTLLTTPPVRCQRTDCASCFPTRSEFELLWRDSPFLPGTAALPHRRQVPH